MRVSDTIPNLIGGVSQQAFALRQPSQGQEQINAYSSLVEGLRKRPPTEFVKRLSTTTIASVHTHTINRDAVEQYEVIVSDGDIRVFDIEGVEKTVNIASGAEDYLDSDNPEEDFAAVTVADFTFIVNRTIEAAMTATASTAASNEKLVYVRQGDYGVNYSVTVGASTYTHLTPDGDDPTDVQDVATDVIAEALRVLIAAGSHTVTRFGSTLIIATASAVTVADGRGGTTLISVPGKIQLFEDLPAFTKDAYKVEVIGDPSNAYDNYWVQFSQAEASWVEAIGPAVLTTIDPDTMPHQLVREEDGTFTFEPATWATRDVGDDVSNPLPSFIGKRINNVVFEKNRLGLLADENTILSNSGDFFNFFHPTVTTLLDESVIDIAAPSADVAILKNTVPWNSRLLVCSEKVQFELTGSPILTPKTGALKATTHFNTTQVAKPLGSGRSVLFATSKGSNYAGLLEYLEVEREVPDGADVSAHVPKYIPGTITQMTVEQTEGVLALITSTSGNTIYVYKFYFDDDGNKLQSAWFKWTLACTAIHGIQFVGTTLFIIAEYADGGVDLLKMSVDAGRSDPYTEILDDDGVTVLQPAYMTLLDRRIDESQLVSATYDAETNTTALVLPYVVKGSPRVVTRATSDAANKPGRLIRITDTTSATVTVRGDHSETPLWIGEMYEMSYEFSPQVVREPKQGGFTVNINGRLQVTQMAVVFNDTGYFRVEVTAEGRTTKVHKFTGREIGAGDNVIGRVILKAGTKRFPVGSRNDRVRVKLINDSHLPCAFQSAEWMGNFTPRSRRVGG